MKHLKPTILAGAEMSDPDITVALRVNAERAVEELHRLRAEVEALKSRLLSDENGLALKEWLDKTEWVQKTAEPEELGLHRADVLKGRIDRLQSFEAKAHRMMDLYAALGVKPGQDPFIVISKLREERPQQEPVSGVVLREGLPTLLQDRHIESTDQRLYTAPQPQQQQVPVAWLGHNGSLAYSRNWFMPSVRHLAKPLYASPQPQRKPLTEEQIIAWIESGEYNVRTNDWASHIDFVRAVEAAHGIKE